MQAPGCSRGGEGTACPIAGEFFPALWLSAPVCILGGTQEPKQTAPWDLLRSKFGGVQEKTVKVL